MSFSNAKVQAAATRLFSSSDADQTPMAGRRQELQMVLEAVKDPALAIVRLWAPLGAGKTFFLTKLWGAMTRDVGVQSELEFIDVQPASKLTLKTGPIVTKFDDGSAKFRSILVVEEFDTKTGFEKLVRVIERAHEWITTTSAPSPLLVLTGDAFLTHPVFDDVFNSLPQALLTLDPLTPPLLTEALALRMDKEKGVLADEPQAESLADAGAVLSDPYLIAGLVPPTNPPGGTFRDALSTLRRLADRLPPRDETIEVPRSLLRHVADEPPTELPGELLRALRTVITESDVVPAMDDSALAALAQASTNELHGDPDEYENLDYYVEEAVEPLVRSGYLQAVGVPYRPLGDAGPREPGPEIQGPYVPAPKAYRLAYS